MSRFALISVSDKTEMAPLATALVNTYGFTLISSGGTAKLLREAGIPVTPVGDFTGAPEILGGRVKTLHPRVHGGILANLSLEQHQQDLATQGIPAIELVVVNLYPFEQTVAQPDTTVEQAIEQIDIGGPTLVRAAAKNYAHVTVLTDPSQYGDYLQQLQQKGPTLSFRWHCARQAFDRILAYDQAIATYFQAQPDPELETPPLDITTEGSLFPPRFQLSGILHQPLRYGENPHQGAAWYRDSSGLKGWSSAKVLQGKALSYNNLVDLEAARAIAADMPEAQPVAVIIKHTIPCGVAVGETLKQAYERALAADPVSAFGGIVALTRPLDGATAQLLTETFLECVVVPDVDPDAAEVLAKKKNLRVLVLPDLRAGPTVMVRSIAGGFLAQEVDRVREDAWRCVTQRDPLPQEQAELRFAWQVCKHVKSNAIVISKAGQTLGIGGGQTNRVGAVQIALQQAGSLVQGAVLASDGFFPFGDSVELIAQAGITAIIQPGGSLRDQESIDVANQHNIAMLHTGIRHFLH